MNVNIKTTITLDTRRPVDKKLAVGFEKSPDWQRTVIGGDVVGYTFIKAYDTNTVEPNDLPGAEVLF